jgi:hypothetical protein
MNKNIKTPKHVCALKYCKNKIDDTKKHNYIEYTNICRKKYNTLKNINKCDNKSNKIYRKKMTIAKKCIDHYCSKYNKNNTQNTKHIQTKTKHKTK